MRVSNITPNVSFKRVTKQAASHALNEAKKENSLWSTQDVNSLIGKGFASTCYDVGFNKGKVTNQNVLNPPAPSIFAAS